ncbi:MAG: hypothetical protein GQ536_01140 [Candidatus Aminicenantes bacterium]|nr:hypothetical protein [Candidatus Aminicenantes bacterium]
MAVEFSKNQDMAPDRVCVRIADIDFGLVSIDPALKIQIQGASQDFLVPEAKPHVTIEARWDDLSAVELSGQKLFESGAVWQLYQSDSKYMFSLSSKALGSVPYEVAQIRKDWTYGEALLHRGYFNPNESIYPLEYPLDELLMVNFLSLGKGAEMHACGVVDSHGNGHLFLGQSRAGKTTLARLWQKEKGITILSDDRIILRQLDEKIWMYGTPWHGEAELASPAKVPLTRVYFLQHGKTNERIQMGTTGAMARLFACSFLPFFCPEAMEFTLGFFEEVTKAVPCYEFRFLPDRGAVEFIQRLKD